jgi:hypothetical protein
MRLDVRLWWLCTTIASVCPTTGRAAFTLPDERYHVRAEEIHRQVLRDAIGVLELVVPGVHRDPPGSETFAGNPAFAEFAPHVDRIEVYARRGRVFAASAALGLADVIPISVVRYNEERPYFSDCLMTHDIFRVPLTAESGDYREIAFDPIRNRRTWIKLSDHASAARSRGDEHSDQGPEAPIDCAVRLLYQEIRYTERHSRPGPAGWIDIFSKSAKRKRVLYASPVSRVRLMTLSPSSPLLQSPRGRSGGAHDGLFFGEIRRGFAELWLEHAVDVPAQRLGWLRLKEEGYARFADYFISELGLARGPLRERQCVDIFFFGSRSSRTVYELPNDGARTTVVSRAAPHGLRRELFVTQIKDGFALLCEVTGFNDLDFEPADADDSFCGLRSCGEVCQVLKPLGWLKIRDADGRLTIWPMLPESWYWTC